MTHVDTLQVGGAVTSVTAAAASHIAPHPLQYLVWIVAIVAGVFSIYRGWAADRRAEQERAQDTK
jgi:hypothetical protein